MNDIAIRVNNLSKQYRLGVKQQSYKTLRDQIADGCKSLFSRNGRSSAITSAKLSGQSDTIWALKDVSFEIKHGEVVGLIGRNGSGKSTLLKVLSRITEPTAGQAEICGRVGALLEVGTGFHSELTGRENIYLNGGILGMKRAEIERQFDEIVSFAEVDRFIDTPVKHYSSGMYLRLAFAVAAHLNPEILLVDEVLAVGDATFQKKCLGKMNEVAQRGRTVLFVSHNMAAIRQLCRFSLLLEDGAVADLGPTDEVIDGYLTRQSSPHPAATDTRHLTSRSGSGAGRIVHVSFIDGSGRETTTFGIGKPFEIWFEVDLPSGSAGVIAGLQIMQADGSPLVNLRSDSQGVLFQPRDRRDNLSVGISIPPLGLYPGRYLVEPWIRDRMGREIDVLHGSLWITFESQGVYASERKIQQGRGILLVDCEWKQ